jgi:hypothetical protein
MEEKGDKIKWQVIFSATRFVLFFSSRLLVKNVKIDVYNTTVVSVVRCKCGILCPALMEDYSLWLFENRVIENIWTEERGSNR